MNKQELAQVLSDKVASVSRAQAEKMLDVMTRTITEKLRAGEEVVFAGFGAFSSRTRKGRVGVNPRNVNEEIKIPDTLVAKFKPGKNLKDSLKRAGNGQMEEEMPQATPAESEPMEEENSSEESPQSEPQVEEPMEEENSSEEEKPETPQF